MRMIDLMKNTSAQNPWASMQSDLVYAFRLSRPLANQVSQGDIVLTQMLLHSLMYYLFLTLGIIWHGW